MFSPDLAGSFPEKSDPAGWSANHVLRLATFQARSARDSLSVISKCVRGSLSLSGKSIKNAFTIPGSVQFCQELRGASGFFSHLLSCLLVNEFINLTNWKPGAIMQGTARNPYEGREEFSSTSTGRNETCALRFRIAGYVFRMAGIFCARRLGRMGGYSWWC